MPSFHSPRLRGDKAFLLFALCFIQLYIKATCVTDSGDIAVLQAFLKSVTNPSKLSSWQGDPCDDGWKYVSCSGSRVAQLQLNTAGLEGSLPSNLNQLSSLEQIALQGNSLSGPLPSFSGLSALTTAYLGDQQFTSIPSDFFKGLSSLVIFTLQNNPINSSSGWSLPSDIASASGLTTLVLTNTSLMGPIPELLSTLTSLQELRLSYNNFTGGIPSSFSNLVQLARFELNNNIKNKGGGLSGPIDVVANMQSLTILWLHVNSFSGTIPSALGSLVSLEECKLNDNDLVGTIPTTFSTSTSLRVFTVKGNQLLGPIPKMPISDPSSYVYADNKFCQSEVGVGCTTEVSALISFLEYMNFPISLLSSWNGSSSCSLRGITCDSQGKVISIGLSKAQLSGRISPDLANLTSLGKLVLNDNNLTGTIPASLTTLSSLVLINVSNNDLYGPIPSFDTSRVSLDVTGNLHINDTEPPPSATPPPNNGPSKNLPSPSSPNASSPTTSGSKSSSSHVGTIAGVVVGVFAIVVSAIIGLAVCKKKNQKFRRVQSPNTAYLRASECGDDGDVVKITVNSITPSGVQDVLNTSNRTENFQVLEAGNLVISIQLLRSVTNNFSEENVLGQGGFGVVYKGELDDGTKIAVKRMLASIVSNKGLDEFQAEIAVLTKVRHRHLVALLGYCIEGNERLLVYEYMPLGTLSQHLFEWNKLDLPHLTWERRLSIALDVARGIEYLHGLAHKSFIHRDLKPSNILLGDDFRAKVSDFGLVKLAPEGGKFSVETRLAGTFGYLAPEYAVTGRVTTKADVFSFGVVLMELLTGRKALDETQPEESMHLVTWFRRQLGNKGSLFNSIDSALQVNDDISQSILTVAELAGHCTSREPYNRPDMGHAVNVLGPLVEQWKPSNITEDDEGIDLHMTLPQALKKWQAFEGSSFTSSDYMDDNPGASMASLPARPSGLAQTFTSNDGR